MLLHLEGELVAGDAGREFRIVGMLGEVLLVLLAEPIEHPALGRAGHAGGSSRSWIAVPSARTTCLEKRRACSRSTILGSGDGAARFVEHDDVARQVFIFAAQSVGEPAAELGCR